MGYILQFPPGTQQLPCGLEGHQGNKSEKENDLGSANVVITVRTGQIVIYTTLIISVLGILFVGIYSIKKYVIKN